MSFYLFFDVFFQSKNKILRIYLRKSRNIRYCNDSGAVAMFFLLDSSR
jgi:hypothetical protein